MKLCKKCGHTKPLTEFNKHKNHKDGRQTWCAECMRYYRKKEYDCKGYFLRRKFGMTPSEYAGLLDSQGGVCAICSRPEKTKSLAVDHDHTTGRVRGLLCEGCNQGLGRFRDDPVVMLRAVEYLSLKK